MKKIAFIIITLLFFSCQNERVYFYYDTGEIGAVEEIINKHKTYYRQYHKTGEIALEGMLIDSLDEGLWKAYYSDGILFREAFFHKGQVDNYKLQQMVSEGKYSVTFEFEDNPNEVFKVGNTYYYRVLTSGVWDIAIITKGLLSFSGERADFPHRISPQNTGTVTFEVEIRDSEGNILATVPHTITIIE